MTEGATLTCAMCGARRSRVDMAISWGPNGQRAWCHPFLATQPTCYMKANQTGEAYR